MMRKYVALLFLGPFTLAGGQKSTTLEAVRAYALSYYRDLPDYTCVQETDRTLTRGGSESHSVIEEELSFVGGKETYKVTRVNGSRAANITHEQLGGTTSTGEYGSLLHHIFDPDTGAGFQPAASTKLQGRTMNVFTFNVPQAKGYLIYDDELERDLLLAYQGSVYADAETNAVMRIMMKCVDFPSGTRLTAAELTLDYKPAQLSNQKFILPSHFTLVWRRRKVEATGPRQPSAAQEETNEGEFKLYHRFKADSTIDFTDKENGLSGQSANGQAKK
jgi:hypothetical protein